MQDDRISERCFLYQIFRRKTMNHNPNRSRSIVALVSMATLAMLVLLAAIALAPATTAFAQDDKDADVIVQFGDTDVAARPITFTTPISGLRALELSGLDLITTESDFGTLVCSIDGVGCPADDCFCGGTSYWGYNYWDGAGWQGYMVGASSSVISQTGAIEGWRWGEFGDPMVPVTQTESAQAALGWLRGTQVADGGFGSSGATVETMMAMGANRLQASDWITGANKSFMDHWAADEIADDDYANNAAKYASVSAAANGKLLVAAAGAGEDVHNFAGEDLSKPLMEHYNADSGVFGDNNWDQAFGMLGWGVAYTTPVPSKAVEVVATRVISDGGWGWAPGLDSDTNTTALMVQALRAADQCTRRGLVVNAVDYLRATQNADGGFPYAAGGDSDANSTAIAIQAILAAGENPDGAAWTKSGNTPYDFLAARQLADGSLEWLAGMGTNTVATQQAVIPLLNGLFPLHTESVSCGEIFLPVVNN